MKKFFFLAALIFSSPAVAQWQVPSNTIPYGRGPGVVGFGSITNSGSGTLCLLNTAPPSFGACGTATAPALATNRVFVGNASNVATAVVLSGDCTIVAAGAITCTKTNNVAFGAFATSTDAANLTGTVASARISGSYTGITAVGTIATGVWQGTIIDTARGGFGTSVAAATGVPLFAAGTPTFTSTTGTGNFVRASGATMTGAALNGTLGATTPSTVAATDVTVSGATGGSSILSRAGTIRTYTWYDPDGNGLQLDISSIFGTGMTFSKDGRLGIGTTSPSAQLHTTSTVRFAGISGVGTAGCLGNDTSGNITGGNACSGTGFPSGGVKGDVPYYSAAGTGAATTASDANAIIQGADPTGAATSTAAAVLAYGYSKNVVFPPAPGGTTATYKFSTNITFPVGTRLIIPCGVKLKPDAGIVVRNLGVTIGGQCQIADTSAGGSVYLGRDVRPEWWPSTGGDDTLAINAADASTTDAATNSADGTKSIIRLACRTYTIKTAIILNASSTNPQDLVGCGDSTILDPSTGAFARGVLTQKGQTAGGGSDLMEFTWRDFAINCSADQNVQGITLGTTTNAIRSYTRNVLENVRISNCRVGIGWYNTRLMALNNLWISVKGQTTSTATAILMDFDDTNQFNGDSDINGGQFECQSGSVSAGAGYGLRMKSNVAGSNNSGIRIHAGVFYYCNKMIYGEWASTGTMGDHWITGGTQCETCGNIADYSGSTGTKKAAMLRFDDIYVTGTVGQPYFRFAGGNTDEIVDVYVHGIRVRGGGGCAGCRFASLEYTANGLLTDNQLISFEGTGGNPNEIINLTAVRKVSIIGNTVDADGIVGAVPNLVTAGTSSSDVFVTNNSARSAVSATWNAASVSNVCVANNLPSASSGC